jgi:hypothetical protein
VLGLIVIVALWQLVARLVARRSAPGAPVEAT